MPLNKDACHTLLMCPLHCYCSLHIDPTLLHIKVKQNNNLQLLLTILFPHMWEQPICPSNAMCMQHMPRHSCLDIRQLWQYICFIWTHCSHHCHHKHWYTYTPNYWHMPLNIYACHIRHVCPPALVTTITAHTIHIKITWCACMGKVCQCVACKK